mmetsp:Transcript_18715/g.47338  ORF Transcript_18715/g.47338 Transcript_18715/m.47338 type:complete len:414 (-) Transcript_18715:248-1489(-)
MKFHLIIAVISLSALACLATTEHSTITNSTDPCSEFSHSCKSCLADSYNEKGLICGYCHLDDACYSGTPYGAYDAHYCSYRTNEIGVPAPSNWSFYENTCFGDHGNETAPARLPLYFFARMGLSTIVSILVIVGCFFAVKRIDEGPGGGQTEETHAVILENYVRPGDEKKDAKEMKRVDSNYTEMSEAASGAVESVANDETFSFGLVKAVGRADSFREVGELSQNDSLRPRPEHEAASPRTSVKEASVRPSEPSAPQEQVAEVAVKEPNVHVLSAAEKLRALESTFDPEDMTREEMEEYERLKKAALNGATSEDEVEVEVKIEHEVEEPPTTIAAMAMGDHRQGDRNGRAQRTWGVAAPSSSRGRNGGTSRVRVKTRPRMESDRETSFLSAGLYSSGGSDGSSEDEGERKQER